MEIEQHFEFREKRFEHVSVGWKFAHIGCYIANTIVSVLAYYMFGSLINFFDGSCPLYANVYFDVENFTLQPFISLLHSEWGKSDFCEFCQCSLCLSFIFSVVWIPLFMTCGKRRLPHGWKIVVPALVFNTCYFAISFTSATFLHKGLKHFCKTFSQDIINNESCKHTDDYLRQGPKRFRSPVGVYGTFLASQTTSWICCGLWFVALLLLLLRIFTAADFQLVQVTTYILEEATSEILIQSQDEMMSEGVPFSTSASAKSRKKAVKTSNGRTQTVLTMKKYKRQ